MVSVFGEGFDVVNGIWYTIEGDGVNATISFASTIPLVYLTSAKYIGKIVKLADGSYSVVKFGGKSTKEFLENIKRIDLDADGLKQLNKDLADKEFAEAIVEDPKLVDSWKVLSGAGIDDGVRRNVDELELVSKNIDEIKAFDGGYKAWKINNAGGGLVSKLNLGKYVKKIGDYEVFENGEVFYRGISKADFEYLKLNGKLKVSSSKSEMFTSPSLEYIKSVGYGGDGVIVKIKVKKGTLSKLEQKGIRDQSARAKILYPNMQNPQSPKGWMDKGQVYFKQETIKGTNSKQVNIGLGRNLNDGGGLKLFNDNVL